MSDDEDLFAQLEDVFDAVDAEDIVGLDCYNEMELRDRFVDIEDRLKELEQVLWPVTQEARDLHSERNAIQVELRNRGLQA